MPDLIDQLSEGKKISCPYPECDETREDLNPEVAQALINNHILRDHALDEE